MKYIARFSIIPVLALALVACKGSDKTDDALNNDLSLAAQARSVNGLDTITAAERAAQAQAAAPAPTTTTVHHVVHHTYSSSGASSSSSSSSARSSEPIDHVEKHPGRDAAIGAGAGAILGAVTSKDKVKGGLIGAAAGGILGAVVGNNVDKKKVPNK
jgi:hypothetical protein